MLQSGFAEHNCSSWSSSVLADKSDGSDQFCTDFRKVNTQFEACIDNVGSANFVSKLDLLKGYWQVPLTPRAKEISVFVTPYAFLQYTDMPFGVRTLNLAMCEFVCNGEG